MFTDMVGYTALGQKNETLSLALVEEQKKLIRPTLAKHNGREVKTMGDAFLVEFPNAVDAVRCAYDIQRAIREFNLSLASDKRIHLRVGVHVGEVVESQGDISGDAVNVASRIEPLAPDGGVCVTSQVYDFVRGKVDLPLLSAGPKTLKNVSAPIDVYSMVMPWEEEHAEISRQLDSKRVAVLPFVNMSSDSGDEYFADGVTEELISTISNIAELSVISRTSTSKFKGGGKTISEIGNELRAGSILEGSVRKADNSIRVTAQLIDANNDRHLWSRTYDRELKDVFALQGDIARQVASALQVSILSPEMERIGKEPTGNPNAVNLYLKGRYLWNRRGIEDLKKAAEYFEKSIKEDPSFPLGYAGLADCHLLLYFNWNLDPNSNLEEARRMAGRAIELDPGLAEARATQADILWCDYKPREAEEEFKRAIELKPNYATAHQWYFWQLVYELRWDEAQEHIETAAELDPLSSAINWNLSTFSYLKRDYREALELAKKVLDLNPTSGMFHLGLMEVYGRLGMLDDAKMEGELGVRFLQSTHPYVGKAVEAALAAYEDDKAKVAILLPELELHLEESVNTAFTMAGLHFYLGETDVGFEWLEKSLSRRESSIWLLGLDPELDGIRADPRYLNLLDRVGLGLLKNKNPWPIRAQSFSKIGE
jgi:adenylate cyclase